MTRVAVIGGMGQLGSDLTRVLSFSQRYEVLPLNHANVEVTDLASVRAALVPWRPDVVVNCAGFVRVDECEDRAEEAFRVNAVGALHVGRICATLSATCVYISTDYVFSGAQGRPYAEDDPPDPINVYGASKAAGEWLLRQAAPRWLIVRMASLYGRKGAHSKGGNFVETMLAKARAAEQLRVVADNRMTPIYAHDAARAIEFLIREGQAGVFHVANGGSCSWYEFARQIFTWMGMPVTIEPVPSDAYPTKARRPRYSSLASVRLPAGMAWARPWEDALRSYLVERGDLQADDTGMSRSISRREHT